MKEYILNVDPRILELLGPNLYTNIYYVLAELIANAYDADAENVYIDIEEEAIRVEDDGHGMSYENGDIARYLNIAAVSRHDASDSKTLSGRRMKMGRKGVGKLAALSVSENVDVLTISSNGEKSGFVLPRVPEDGNRLKPINESDISFKHIDEHGSAIVMHHPQYSFHKTMNSIKRNLLKIFPLVDDSFRIHVIRGDEKIVIEDFDKNTMQELCALITLGERFDSLCDLVPKIYEEEHDRLVEKREAKSFELKLENHIGEINEYKLEIQGWIGVYKSTRGRKAETTDFPDNFISLYANGKMGEFNILPIVGQNKLNEVYVVGQLHVDLFELSELPDMALSNRQGYKSDDPRYVQVIEYVKTELLPDILNKRKLFTDIGKKKKKEKDRKEQLENEKKLKESVEKFKREASQEAAKAIVEHIGSSVDSTMIEEEISKSINENAPDLGLKSVIDSQKKKILISQTYGDKPFADIVYQMLVYNNVPPEDILYTNCDNEVCRIPEGRKVYEYLRDFFVESYSTQKIMVIFVTSENTKMSWGAITEVGAAWITQIDHKIFNIHPFRPEHPLDDESQWQTTNRDEPTKGDLWMNPLSADVFCAKIEHICDLLGYEKRSRIENKEYLETLVEVK